MQKSTIKPTKVTKIFISHAHGDHSFGLPGLLCFMGQDYVRDQGMHLEIYGPAGLRLFVRAAMRYTYSRITVPYVVHELMDVPYIHHEVKLPRRDFDFHLPPNRMYGEQPGGRDIYPDANGHFLCCKTDKVTVTAAPMKHTVPCVGYVVEEVPKPGRLKQAELKPILDKHREAIISTGIKDPRRVFGDLKVMKPGGSYTIPGTDEQITYEQALMPGQKGRKIVILGDTCDASRILALAQEADVIVHESTNAYILPRDEGKTYADVENDAIVHGHSTPAMATEFALACRASQLVLTHFSSRYKGCDSPASVAGMMRIERQAMRAGGLARHEVVAAWDMLILPVLSRETRHAHKEAMERESEEFESALVDRAREWAERKKVEDEELKGVGGEE
ncbi:unnamed protein product [Choristocarpus tenellus]